MPRPREFDEQDVLDRALNAFWARGYDATSVEDLVEATGLGRASLYGAFGDKEQLFRRVVTHYMDRGNAEAVRLTQHLAPREALHAFVLSRLERAARKDQPAGCFMQISATSGTSAQLIAETAQVALKETRDWLLRQVKKLQDAGGLAKSADASLIADQLVVLIHGLTASSKARMPLKTLRVVARQGVDAALGAK